MRGVAPKQTTAGRRALQATVTYQSAAWQQSLCRISGFRNLCCRCQKPQGLNFTDKKSKRFLSGSFKN